MNHNHTINPNSFEGSDSQRINQAVAEAARRGAMVVIPRRNERREGVTDTWLLDEAILLPSHSQVLLQGCHLQLSNRCRDNFFRSANLGSGEEPVSRLEKIQITGTAGALLEGATAPRATGDSRKRLGENTFGTDAGVKGESQLGDWRNYGIYLHNVRGIRLEGFEIRNSHCWGITLQSCSDGLLRDLHFDSSGFLEIDGVNEQARNQDGIDLRRGCRNFLIENITGATGDDLIALTALPPKNGFDKSQGEAMAIQHVMIRNVRGYCRGGHNIIRLLNAPGIPLRDVLIDGLFDTSHPPYRSGNAIKIGEKNPHYGGAPPLGETARIFIHNLSSRARNSILIEGSLTDSVISNVFKHDAEGPAILYQSGPDHIRNVTVSNVWPACSPGQAPNDDTQAGG